MVYKELRLWPHGGTFYLKKGLSNGVGSFAVNGGIRERNCAIFSALIYYENNILSSGEESSAKGMYNSVFVKTNNTVIHIHVIHTLRGTGKNLEVGTTKMLTREYFLIFYSYCVCLDTLKVFFKLQKNKVGSPPPSPELSALVSEGPPVMNLCETQSRQCLLLQHQEEERASGRQPRSPSEPPSA